MHATPNSESLVIVGPLGLDSIRTPYGEKHDIVGGCLSFASMAAAFFTKVQAVGVIGSDFPGQYLELFRTKGIDTQGIQTLPGKNFRWQAYYEDNLNIAHTLHTELNVLESYKPHVPDAFKAAKLLLLGNIDPVVQLQVVEQLTAPHFVVCDTMNFWIKDHHLALHQTLRKVDLLCINEEEVRLLTGTRDLLTAYQFIKNLGPRYLIIKRGEYGTLLLSEDDLFALPAWPLAEVRDPTGAGDSFVGGFMGFLHYLLQQEELLNGACPLKIPVDLLRMAIVMGATLASFAITDFSIERLVNLTPVEIFERFQAFKRLTTFNEYALETLKRAS